MEDTFSEEMLAGNIAKGDDVICGEKDGKIVFYKRGEEPNRFFQFQYPQSFQQMNRHCAGKRHPGAVPGRRRPRAEVFRFFRLSIDGKGVSRNRGQPGAGEGKTVPRLFCEAIAAFFLQNAD